MSAYYNEIDPYAAQWLRNLIAAGHIAPGDVDTRSIVDVQPDDLRGYTQCHFFAGLGGWSHALRLAGWPDDRPIWTGSCPCQPFSSAGKQKGFADERHLWPEFFRLIRERRPGRVFGEQVARSAGYVWWDAVAADLESEDYAAAAADLGAHTAGAPHIRQRLYWVADAHSQRHARQHALLRAEEGRTGESAPLEAARRSAVGVMADTQRGPAKRRGYDLASPARGVETEAWQRQRVRDELGAGINAGVLEHADDKRLEGRRGESGQRAGERAAGSASPWDDLEWLPCSDGKARPTQPGLFPLAHGVSGRVGRLRAYGNAIVPQVAEAFIRATYQETA